MVAWRGTSYSGGCPARLIQKVRNPNAAAPPASQALAETKAISPAGAVGPGSAQFVDLTVRLVDAERRDREHGVERVADAGGLQARLQHVGIAVGQGGEAQASLPQGSERARRHPETHPAARRLSSSRSSAGPSRRRARRGRSPARTRSAHWKLRYRRAATTPTYIRVASAATGARPRRHARQALFLRARSLNAHPAACRKRRTGLRELACLAFSTNAPVKRV